MNVLFLKEDTWKKTRFCLFICFAFIILFPLVMSPVSPAGAVIDKRYLDLVSTIDLGEKPLSIAVNEKTNRIYVGMNRSIAVIDGLTDTIISELPIDFEVKVLKVNPATDQLFVSASDIWDTRILDASSGSLVHTLDDEMLYPSEIAINSVTNRIYLADWTVVQGEYDKVRILDGNTFEEVGVIDVPGSDENRFIQRVYVEVNPLSNLLYILWSGNNGTLHVVDGDTFEILTIKPYFNREIYLNLETNYLYVGESVLDGNSLVEVYSEFQRRVMAIDSIHNLVYSGQNDVLYVIDGNSQEVKYSVNLNNWIEYSPAAINSDTGKFYLTNEKKKQLYVFEFIEDNASPLINITSPVNCSQIRLTYLQVTWNGSDAGSGISFYEVKLDDNSWSQVEKNTKYTFNDLSEGNHVVSIKAHDMVGNTREATINFVVDVTIPEINIVSPASSTKIKEDSITVIWTGSDNLSGIDHYEVSIDEKPAINKETETTHQFTKLNDGIHKIQLKVTDHAGNYRSTTVSFTVDTSIEIPNITTITSLATITTVAIYLHRKQNTK